MENDIDFPLMAGSNGSNNNNNNNNENNNRRSEYGHDRNLSLPSNTPPREQNSRPTRAATYSRASGYIRRPQQQSSNESTPGISHNQSIFTPQTITDNNSGMIYQGSAITTPNDGVTTLSSSFDNNNNNTTSQQPPQTLQQQINQQVGSQKGKNKVSDPKTPSEYALHILFTQFVRYAERKLNQCLGYANESEPKVSEILGEGIDPSFDKIISSLGYIARRKPKPVIDSVMFWRKSKSEAVTQAQSQLNNSNPTDRGGGPSHSRSGSRQESYYDLKQAAIHADRKSWMSIFILCRVLMEVIRQTPKEVLGEDMSEKLEEIVFRQLRSVEPETIATSLIRRDNWNLFSKLLGEMSDSRFVTVADRFIAELEKVPSNPSKDKEYTTQLVIHGMRYLKLRLYPMDMLEESANFLESLAKFFARSQSQSIKLVYSEIISQILLPIAGIATAELNHPTWVQAVDALYTRATEMMKMISSRNNNNNRNKNYWENAFTLATTVLSVAPQELFHNNWIQLFESNVSKIKERGNRACFYRGAARLLWVFMCRCTESLNNTTKKLEIVCKSIVSNSQRKAWLIPDISVPPACVSFLRIASYGHRQFILENVIFQLITGSGMEIINMDNIIPERAIISIKTFVYMLSDIEKNERPDFPTDDYLKSMYYDFKLPQPNYTPQPTGSTKEFYDKYCNLLIKILNWLDGQFGATGSVSEEKQSQQRTPMAVSFHFGNSDNSSSNQKQMLSDLFCVIMDSMPWCLNSASYNRVVEILCRNTINSNIRISSIATRSLKGLASTRGTKNILSTISKQLFSFDEKLFTAYEPISSVRSDYEKFLRIYVELLEIWIEKIKSLSLSDEGQGGGEDTKDSTINGWWPTIEEVEGNGLYFLCSPERGIRHLAIKILRLIAKFDSAVKDLQKNSSNETTVGSSSNSTPARLITFLDKVDLAQLFERAKPEVTLSMPERTRLKKLMSYKKKEALIKSADSEHGIDSALWLKAFPTFMKECFEKYPIPVAIARNVICFRLVGMHDVITEFMRTEDPMNNNNHQHGFLAKHSTRTHPEVVIEQWRIYLVVACLALTLTDEQKLHIPDNSQTQHGRKKSAQKITIHHQRITSIKSVFRMVIPLLGVDHPIIRDAIITGISCINVNTYQALLECIKPAFENWKLEVKSRYAIQRRGETSTISTSSIGYNRQDRVITEIAHVIRVTAYYLEDEMIYNNEYIMNQLVEFLKDLRIFLSQSDIQTSWDYQKLRRYFCGIVDKVIFGISKSQFYSKLLTFDNRLKFYNLIEEWCDFGINHTLSRDRDAIIKQTALANTKDSRDRNVILATMEIEKKKFEIAVLSSMAALCSGGPIVYEFENNNGELRTNSFNLFGILKWINNILRETEDLQNIGNQALKYLLKNNINNINLFNECISNCYQLETGRGTESDAKVSRAYFKTIAETILNLNLNENCPCPLRQILTVGLFKTGDNDFKVRFLAAKLLRCVELKFYDKTCMNEFESRILSKSPPIYKRVLFELSGRFAKDHPEANAMVLSEMFMYFHKVGDAYRRDILSVLLPWVQTIELKVEPKPNDQLLPASMMVLCNLLEITITFSDRINTEVEALWVAVISGIPTNLKIVMDFLFKQNMAKPDANFVSYAKKIVYHMSTFQRGPIIEFLISQLNPKSMIPMHPEPYSTIEAKKIYPHVAEISELLPPRTKENAFSYGQLALILLVDLMIQPQEDILQLSQIPLLLHSSLVLMDHYLLIVQEQAREMLILCLLGYKDNNNNSENLQQICDKLRDKDGKFWNYDDLNNESDGAQTPREMDQLITTILKQFDSIEIQKLWARVALNWATSCPVRHIACRSFQIFRCLLSFLDQGMLADMLARLSNTISDNTLDIQGFAMQILMTLNAITAELESEELINYPQLFWATVACMSTVHEQEFIEVLSILEKFLSKIDLDSTDTVSCLISTFPPKWEGKFEGLQRVVMNGLKSCNSWDQSLRVLDKLNQLNSNNELISQPINNNERLVLALCANLPRYLHALEIGEEFSIELQSSCEYLKNICNEEDRIGLSRILTSLSKNRFRTKKDFLNQTIQSIKTNFFPQHEITVLSFFLGILSNKTRWVKEESMEILKLIFPIIDMKREELSGVGADLISPLLRLLQTDFAEQALSVLDEASSISSSKMDKHVLRMSLGNRTIRKEYEKTYTLFGIPDDSGWAIPMPAVTATITRNNVHAVFYTCAAAANVSNDQVDDEFQFHKEEQYYGGGGGNEGFPLNRTESVSVEGSMNQMWNALDNLDNFFQTNNDGKRRFKRQNYSNNGNNNNNNINNNNNNNNNNNRNNNHTHNYMNSFSVTDTDASVDNAIDPVESAPQLYDKKVSIILNRSLARTPSTTSFKTTLADSFVDSNNNNNIAGGSSSGNAGFQLKHFNNAYRSKRREIVDFGQDLDDISGSSDGDDEEADDDDYDNYNNGFDTIRFDSSGGGGTGGEGSGTRKNSSSTNNSASPLSQPFKKSNRSQTSPSVTPPALPTISDDYQQTTTRKQNIPQQQQPTQQPVAESSFRFESLLKGASSLGKKKKHQKDQKDAINQSSTSSKKKLQKAAKIKGDYENKNNNDYETRKGSTSGITTSNQTMNPNNNNSFSYEQVSRNYDSNQNNNQQSSGGNGSQTTLQSHSNNNSSSNLNYSSTFQFPLPRK